MGHSNLNGVPWVGVNNRNPDGFYVLISKPVELLSFFLPAVFYAYLQLFLLLKYSAHTPKFTLFKKVYHLVGFSIFNKAFHPFLLSNSVAFSSPQKETSCPLAVTFHFPFPQLPGNQESAFCLYGFVYFGHIINRIIQFMAFLHLA